ncbi:FdhF/YdeP family oxidoreductase [Candidatus Thiosymbion oneisti]|uniref:FdhF/YdeP family oxidoreductase n=1 Tax=Candidatus Thiosymbion oneisti TaxID=589554 RepID=UPI000ACF8FDB|nr:FdhF/YdeP family oxidoreductase [Candidatus Thiosymbion oneisti]
MAEQTRQNRTVAGGLGALLASARHLWHHRVGDVKCLLRTNQPGGFDCPGCAWPEPRQASRLELCENGIKAIVHEATQRRIGREFFARHTLSQLRGRSHYWLEQQGRLTEPLRYNRHSDRYEPIGWEAAFSLIGRHLRGLDHPDQAVLYTSGRTSNEAAFLLQLFGRLLGTNNLPDSANLCHESSGVALTEAIGTGKGTVTLEDFALADAIFVFGQNPGSNHPRMLTELEKAARRGCKIVSVNPLQEAGLTRFINPKHLGATLFQRPTSISSLYLQPLVGGDLALIKGMMKVLLERETQPGGGVLDQDFIDNHTQGFTACVRDLEDTTWTQIEAGSGLSRAQITQAAELYMQAERVIACWAMGLTQQKHAVATIQTLTNWMLLGGNLGKPGAGLCPVRGHSNVQGDRTMGIRVKPDPTFLEALGREFRFRPPQSPGYATVDSIKAMAEAKVKALICMGGNLAAAAPDRNYTEEALSGLQLTVQISTKLNFSHLACGKDALILPCLGRTELDLQATGPQQVTVEDSMSMVHTSRGHRRPASPHLRSEPAIVAGMAKAALGEQGPDWDELVADYDRIRTRIAAVIPGFRDYNRKLRQAGGFYLGNSARERRWQTPTGKACFLVHPLPGPQLAPDQLRLMTLRAHDQYNTTIHGLNDRYRGIQGRRLVVFLHPEDMHARGLKEGTRVDLISEAEDGLPRRATGFEVVPYAIPKGCAAAYFPETNVLVPIDSYADRSITPTSKLIPIRLRPAGLAKELSG